MSENKPREFWISTFDINKVIKKLKQKRRTKVQQNINEMAINGVIYVPNGSQENYTAKGDIKIIILQRGWVMVGRLEKSGSECKLHNASVIRSWGTTKGLGELAGNGPIKDKTNLDKCNGVVEFDYLTVVATIACNEAVWKQSVL